jgi:hypothetical protein
VIQETLDLETAAGPGDDGAAPQPASRSTCRSCGVEIAWVRLQNGKLRPMDVTPHPRGEYALLRDGRRVLDLRNEELIAPDVADRIPNEIRYFDHVKTCRVPSLRATRALIESTAVTRKG